MQDKVFVLISPKNRTAYNFRGDLIREIISRGYTVYVTGPDRIDEDKIKGLGAEFIEIPNNKNGISVTADLKYFFTLFKLLRKVRASATLGYTIKPVIYGSIAARLAGVRSVNAMVTGAGYLFISQSRKAKFIKGIAKILYKIGLASARNVIFQNPDDRDEFVQNKLVKRDKTNIVNGSGVNMSHFPLAPLPAHTTFFMLSRIMYSKGVMEYLEAARKVKARHPQVRFVLLGASENIQDSIPWDKIHSEFIETGIIDYFPETSDVISFYKQCSVYVLPSYREGTPRTVLEAMAMGRPIISTDVPGCRGTVIDGENGFLVPVKDVDALAGKIEWFIRNPDRIGPMGERSHRICEEKFEVSKVNKDMLSIMGL